MHLAIAWERRVTMPFSHLISSCYCTRRPPPHGQDRLAWLNEQIEVWHGKNTFKDDGKEENSYLSAQ